MNSMDVKIKKCADWAFKTLKEPQFAKLLFEFHTNHNWQISCFTDAQTFRSKMKTSGFDDMFFQCELCFVYEKIINEAVLMMAKHKYHSWRKCGF